MTDRVFMDLLPGSVCGICHERERPPTVQRQHALWWDSILGAYLECPDCGNVFHPPDVWDPETDDVHSDHAEVPAMFGTSILAKYQ